MSSQARRTLREYVINILNRGDSQIERLFRNYEPFMQEQRAYKIEEMNFTIDTLASSLQEIASYLFTPGETYKPHVIVVLFMYCIEIDEYFKKHHQNYKTDLLVDAIVNILISIDYEVPKSYCSIL